MADDWLYRRTFGFPWLAFGVLAATLGSSRVAWAQPNQVRKPPQVMLNDQDADALVALLVRYRVADAKVLPELGLYWKHLYETDRDRIPVLLRQVPIALAPLGEMALTDLAIRAFDDEQIDLGDKHLNTAEQFIDIQLASLTAPEDDPARDRQIRFERDWYKAIIWLRCLQQWDVKEENAIIARALERFPNDSDLLLAAGTSEELGLTRGRAESDKISRSPTDKGKQVDLTKRQKRAVGYFRETIRRDPRNPNAVEARIRLAFLLMALGSSQREEAMRLLKEARAIDSKPPLGYLAALFAGSIEEARQHPDAASSWYRRAIDDCPLAQTARFALSHLQLDLQGDMQGAQNTLGPLIAGPRLTEGGCDPDPWRLYDFGQFWRLHRHLEQMRAMVREAR